MQTGLANRQKNCRPRTRRLDLGFIRKSRFTAFAGGMRRIRSVRNGVDRKLGRVREVHGNFPGEEGRAYFAQPRTRGVRSTITGA